MNWAINSILALIIVCSAIILFSLIVFMGVGGDEALFLVIGYIAAWAQMVVIYYFRKKTEEK